MHRSQRRDPTIVCGLSEEVYSSAGFYDTADAASAHFRWKGQTPLESAVVYERLSLPESSGWCAARAQLGTTGGAASNCSLQGDGEF